jgi:serine/threonine-protein kinase
MQIEKLGPYRIGRTLGRGGMGTVYAAEAIDTGIPAAVKVLATSLSHDSGFRERFEVEIETLRKLRHPHIVRLFGFGEDQGFLFYAMELVDGASLEEELQSGRRFHWREIIPISIKIAQALRHAHDRGVIHRDIKPANLLLGAEGEIKLSDFGIAKLFGASGMTAGGGVIGTAEYMAPEQADGRPVTHRCDLYSLGCVMYALCAGRPPFRARSLPEMLHMQRYAEPDPLRKLSSDVPPELEQLISELLIKDPDKRIPTAMVLARRLEAMEHGLLRRERRSLSDDGETTFEDDEFTYRVGDSLEPGDSRVQTSETTSPRDDFAFDVKDDDQLAATQLAISPHNAPTLGADSPPASAVMVPRPTIELRLQDSAGPPAPGPTTVQSSQREVAPPKTSRFTRVEAGEESERPAPWDHRVGLQALALVSGLVLIGLGAWFFLKPESADALYQRITAATVDGDADALATAEPDIKTFLARYSDDPRANDLQALQAEIELDRLQRRLERRLRLGGKNHSLSAVERAYAAARHTAEFDPTEAIKKYQALLAVYSGDDSLSKTDRQCVELAQRQLARLEIETRDAQASDLAELDRQFQRADALRSTDPATATRIWQGVIDLYGDQDWARPAVEKARQSLDELAKTASQ